MSAWIYVSSPTCLSSSCAPVLCKQSALMCASCWRLLSAHQPGLDGVTGIWAFQNMVLCKLSNAAVTVESSSKACWDVKNRRRITFCWSASSVFNFKSKQGGLSLSVCPVKWTQVMLSYTNCCFSYGVVGFFPYPPDLVLLCYPLFSTCSDSCCSATRDALCIHHVSLPFQHRVSHL